MLLTLSDVFAEAGIRFEITLSRAPSTHLYRLTYLSKSGSLSTFSKNRPLSLSKPLYSVLYMLTGSPIKVLKSLIDAKNPKMFLEIVS